MSTPLAIVPDPAEDEDTELYVDPATGEVTEHPVGWTPPAAAPVVEEPRSVGVSIQGEETIKANPHKIPAFEGQEVHFTKAKLTSVTGLEIEDQVLRMDELLRLVVEGRVVRVDHVVNDRTGHLERIHTIKVIDAQIVDWDAPIGGA